MIQEFLYVEKYRPQTIEDTILPHSIKQTFKEFVKQETSTRQFGNGTSGNVVYWYDDKGGMFFVNSC